MNKIADQTLDFWLAENQGEIEQAQAFASDSLPDDPGPLAEVLSRAQSEFARIGFLLSDAESWVLKAHAAATLESRDKYADLSADERRIMAKADPIYLKVVRLRDNLRIMVDALKSKAFAVMNHRNTMMGGGMH